MVTLLTCSHRGSLKNPPLVFLHGFLGNKEDWDEVITQLEDRFWCLSVALPGHGSPFSLTFSQALQATLKSHGIEQAALVGYSMGGRLALHALQDTPEMGSNVIALSSHPGLREESERISRIGEELKWSVCSKHSR